jgi:diguanylate cyclase (GGDEF)-like protein
MDHLAESFLPIAVQAAGILMVAGLLRPLSRVVPGRFVAAWWVAWIGLASGLLCVFAALHLPAGRGPLMVGYCLGEYLFAFLLWAGCREFATGKPLTAADGYLFLPAAAFALSAPFALPAPQLLFPLHMFVLGAYFALALAATAKPTHCPSGPSTGLWLLRVALAGLTVVAWHSIPFSAYLAFHDATAKVPFIEFLVMLEMLLQTALAFGMVLVAADRMRAELEAKNRQLEAAAHELASTARTDSLTGLLNRRAFDMLPAEVAGRPFAGSVAVIDLNDLKPLNDLRGHAAGDAALQVVARALRGHFRVTDPIFRIGGDEFVVVMPGCPEPDLMERMARIDVALLATRLPGSDGPTDLRISWGVSSFDAGADLPAAVERADAAMYRCKAVRKPNGSSREMVVGVVNRIAGK